MSAVTGSMWPSPGHQKQARRPAGTSASPTRLPLSLACRPASAAQGLNPSCLNRPEPLPARLVRTPAGAAMPVGVLDPRRVRVLRLVEGRKAKTERLDAGLIARSALIMTDVARPAPPRAMMGLQALSTRRRQLVEMIAAEKPPLKQTFEPILLASLKETIRLIS